MSLITPEARLLANHALNKQGFVPMPPEAAAGAAPAPPAGDPGMAAMPMDPAMGGAPPMDPAMGGMPAAPPADPTMAGGAPPAEDPLITIIRDLVVPALGPIITQLVQDAIAGATPATGNSDVGGEGPKPTEEKSDADTLKNIEGILTQLAASSGIMPAGPAESPPPTGV